MTRESYDFMSKTKTLKRIIAFAAAIMLSGGLFADSLTKPALKTSAESESFDITSYAEKLQEISKEQERLDKEIKDAEDDIEKEAQKQKNILKKIDAVNEKIDVLNSYITALEVEITTNKRQISDKKQEIDKGIEDFKKRLRAMYLAGDESYTNILLNSSDFYDVLMRVELVKRVADHDNKLIDSLVKKKEEYEAALKKLEEKQAEYDKQYAELESQKAELDELYNSSKEAKEAYEKKKKELEEENEAYIAERKIFEADLSGILKSSYGDSSDETMRAAAELSANNALEKIYDRLEQREMDGEDIPEDECRYDFAWPVPGHYYVSSGVGERWGTYHTGLDITGAKGTDIHASESGKVIKINTSCPHDYAKEESCGCGNGYGNYIIIDHGHDFITLYGHLTEVNVQVGDEVKQGDLIGHMGSTGFSTGDHLHFEIRYQGYYLNPAAYVSIN